MVGIHVFYYLTGNLAVIIFLVQSKQLMDFFRNYDVHHYKQNISRLSERDFLNDKRFHWPMWACFATGTMSWIWTLCLFSEDVHFTSYYLTKVKPITWPEYLMFWWVIAFISAVET